MNQAYTRTLQDLGQTYIKYTHLYILSLKDKLNILYTWLQNTEEIWKYN
jgi:hypothetical protein